jgi:hypothetical protein
MQNQWLHWKVKGCYGKSMVVNNCYLKSLFATKVNGCCRNPLVTMEVNSCYGNSVVAMEVNCCYGKQFCFGKALIVMENQWLILMVIHVVAMTNQWLLYYVTGCYVKSLVALEVNGCY